MTDDSEVSGARGIGARVGPGARVEPGSMRGCFVTGTDTSVGKTVVACAIVRGLRARGLSVGVRKPIETGVGPDGPLDAAALREAAGSAEPLGAICHVALPLPAAPAVAAVAAGREIAVDALLASVRDASARHDLTVVEGAGGLLVPIAPGYDMADLAGDVGFPLVVVARTRLGSINHTRLTLDAARERGLRVAGVVLCHADGKLSEPDAANLAWLKRALGPALIGEMPPLAAGEPPPRDAIDLDALLERCVSSRGAGPG